MPIGRATIMQIRGQYLIQDNHDDYTSQSAFSRGRGNVMCAHTCTHAHAIPSSHHDRSSSFFPPHVPFHPLTASKCLESPPGGVSWQKCIAAYHTICSRCTWKGREREREGYIYLYLPGVSKVFPLEEGKKTSTFLPPPLSLSSKNLRERTSVASLKRRSNLYRVGIFCWHFSPPKAEQNHARLPPRTYPLGWRVTLEREREREGGRMLVLHRLGPRWEPAANWKLSLITGEHVGRSTPISRGGYCSLSVPIRFPTSAYLGETYS